MSIVNEMRQHWPRNVWTHAAEAVREVNRLAKEAGWKGCMGDWYMPYPAPRGVRYYGSTPRLGHFGLTVYSGSRDYDGEPVLRYYNQAATCSCTPEEAVLFLPSVCAWALSGGVWCPPSGVAMSEDWPTYKWSAAAQERQTRNEERRSAQKRLRLLTSAPVSK